MLPILETKRCILKEVSIENAKDMYEYAKEEKVVKYMTFPKHESIENTKYLIENKVATLGYCLHPDYWNKGIMTEVVKKLSKFGFDELKLDKIVAQFYDGNIKLGNVMKRCGMKYLGSEEREIKLQGKIGMGKIHKCEITKEDYYKD